jgi:hypothetical protein
MLPKVVLHKRNGHRLPPRDTSTHPGELIRLVHSGQGGPTRPTFGLVKFASLVKSETRGALADQAARGTDAVRAAIDGALADTRAAFERGERADIRAMLDVRRGQADLAARMVARLTGVTRTGAPDRRPASRRRLLSLNEAVAETLYMLVPHLGGRLTVVTRLDAGLPFVAGDPNDLGQALAALIVCAAHLALAGGGDGTVVVETGHDEPVVSGERVVCVRVGTEAQGRPEGLDLRAAARIAAEHAGVVRAESLAEGGVRLALELPAL